MKQRGQSQKRGGGVGGGEARGAESEGENKSGGWMEGRVGRGGAVW